VPKWSNSGQMPSKASLQKLTFLFLIFSLSVYHRFVLLIHPIYLRADRAPYDEYSGRYARSVFRGFFFVYSCCGNLPEKDNKMAAALRKDKPEVCHRVVTCGKTSLARHPAATWYINSKSPLWPMPYDPLRSFPHLGTCCDSLS
jgi:hypothetical protein